ncbi:glycosyltransferase family 2 protein [uncultured Psychroserpens sp.]|uniref:glycosyltransferase family 2 protein n=1 Tax=uncultured Psychroserpens sp. TaxID=255436 RepID=UPI00262220CE|nr:glycosyltransferase family 2 protein [uncultured Psychroserpens sp.]
MNPQVSIIIPNYNRARLIGETLDSIINQTFTNWECLVVDDGSTDDSKTVVENYSAKDERIKFYNRPKDLPKGANACRNYGLIKSQGQYVNWIDSDDIFHPSKLEKQLQKLIQNKSLYTICKSYVFEDNITNLIGLKSDRIDSEDPFNDFISKRIIIPIQGPIFQKQFLIDNQFRFDETLQAGQEWEFFARILHKYPNYDVVDEPLDYIRSHSENISNSSENNKYWHYYQARKKLEAKLGAQLSPESKDILNRFYLFIFKYFIRDKKRYNAWKVWFESLIKIKKLSINDHMYLFLGSVLNTIFNKGDGLLSKVSLYNK